MKLKQIKRTKPIKKSDSFQVCPKCGSPDIETDFSNAGAISFGILNNKKCNHCSHVGSFFPAIQKNKVKVTPKKDVKDQIYMDQTFTKGYFSWISLGIGTLTILTAITALLYKAYGLGLFLLVIGLALILIYYLSPTRPAK